MKILTAAQMQRIDRLTSERYGVPSLSLMESAAGSVVEFLEYRFGPLERHRMVILCGRGNNGGDGLVIARLLRGKGLAPRVLLFADPRAVKGDAAANLDRLNETGAPEVIEDSAAWQRVKPSLRDTTLIVDALLGTGLSKPLEGFLLEVVQDVNAEFGGARVVAVDLPTGISADTGGLIGVAMRADASVTFTAPKVAHVLPPACLRVGEWVVRQIGTPPEALAAESDFLLNLTTRQDLGWLAVPRLPESHKGSFGHVLILAGSRGKTGAAALAAKAALRAGAGLVTVTTPCSALPVIASLGMEYMTEPLPETDAGTVSRAALDGGYLDRLVEGKSVLAIGPGLGTAPETTELVRAVLDKFELPIVLDADGLNAYAGRMGDFHRARAARVLTPHPGEMARLTGRKTAEIVADRLSVARAFASHYGVTLALKGFRTLIADAGGQVWVNPTGNPGMATGGTGDVLTGLIAGLLAQHPERPASEVTAAAVYLHGLAGDLAAAEKGQTSLIAGDLLDGLPRSFQFLSEVRARQDERPWM